MPPQSPLDSPSPVTPGNSGTPQPGSARSSISSRACDACRGRRRKCHFDDAGASSPSVPGPSSSQHRPQCYNCRRLGIVCSFVLPSRPRGPKRRKLLAENMPDEAQGTVERTNQQAEGQHPQPVALSNPPGLVLPGDVLPLPRALQATSPFETPRPIASILSPHPTIAGPAETTPSSTAIAGPGFPTDELCSRALINTLMADYLDLVYPLVPVVHRPSFRRDLAANRDVSDPDFFALLVSLCALTVGLLPSGFRDYRAAADHPEGAVARRQYDTRTALIDRCAEVCTRQRPGGYWDRVNHRKWAVSYVLSVACFQTGQVNRSRMFDVEYLQLSRLLGLHRVSEYEGLNCVETQLRKKAFWLMFYGYAHTRVQSGRWERLTYFGPGELREVNFEALVPLEVDDEHILEDRILDPLSASSPAAQGTPSSNSNSQQDAPPPPPPFTLTTAFILHSRVFLTGLRESMATVGCECELRRGPTARLARLRDLLQEMRYMLDDAPGPVRQWASSEQGHDPTTPGHDDDSINDDHNRSIVSSYGSSPRAESTRGVSYYPRVVRGQHEIMRANIHVTHLWLQSLLLEQVDAVVQENVVNDPSAGDVSVSLRANWAEREDICRQMLHLLHSIPHAYLEPNGLYLAYKVRDVAVTLLNCPFGPDTPPARRAAEYMRDFTSALSRLDRSETVNTNSLRSWVDADREPVAAASAAAAAAAPPRYGLVLASPHRRVGVGVGVGAEDVCDKCEVQPLAGS